MGSVGSSIVNTVKNVTQTVVKPVTTLFTQPTKLNLGDAIVLGTAGLAAPTVDAARHPGDTPVIAGAAIGGATLAGVVLGPSAAAPVASATDAAISAGPAGAPASAGAYSASFGSGGGGPGFGLIGSSNPLDLNYVAPTLASSTGPTGSVAGSGGLWGFLGRAGDATKSVFAPILSGIGEVGKAIAAPLGLNYLFSSLNKGNSSPPAGGVSVDTGGSSPPGFYDPGIGGGGFGPYGSILPTSGTPAASNALPSIDLSNTTPSNLSFYFFMALAALAGWYFFMSKRHA